MNRVDRLDRLDRVDKVDRVDRVDRSGQSGQYFPDRNSVFWACVSTDRCMFVSRNVMFFFSVPASVSARRGPQPMVVTQK